VSLHGKQKSAKPKIEETINDYIKDVNLKSNILDFIAWLRKNKMSPSWSARNYYKVSRDKNKILLIRIDNNAVIIERFWRPWKDDECQKFIYDNNLQELVGNNFTVCGRYVGRNCPGCPPSSDFTGMSISICGKEAKNICRGEILYFVNPDYETIEGIKKLVEYR
jgi:hypothetical protein